MSRRHGDVLQFVLIFCFSLAHFLSRVLPQYKTCVPLMSKRREIFLSILGSCYTIIDAKLFEDAATCHMPYTYICIYIHVHIYKVWNKVTFGLRYLWFHPKRDLQATEKNRLVGCLNALVWASKHSIHSFYSLSCLCEIYFCDGMTKLFPIFLFNNDCLFAFMIKIFSSKQKLHLFGPPV